jgi:hypothetical protein
VKAQNRRRPDYTNPTGGILAEVNTILATICGAAIAGVFGLLGVWYGTRREHGQWVRNTRRMAYEALLTSVNRVRIAQAAHAARGSSVSLHDRVADPAQPYVDLFVARSAVQLAGPKKVWDAAERMHKALGETTENPSPAATTELMNADRAFVRLAQEALRIT